MRSRFCTAFLLFYILAVFDISARELTPEEQVLRELISLRDYDGVSNWIRDNTTGFEDIDLPYNPLFAAVQDQDVELLRLLVKVNRFAEVMDHGDIDGAYSLLRAGVASGNLEIVQLLIDNNWYRYPYDSVQDVFALPDTSDEVAILELLFKKGGVNFARETLDYGSRGGALAPYIRSTFLSSSIVNGKPLIARYLADSGYSTNAPYQSFYVWAPDQKFMGKTPLDLALDAGFEEVVSSLLSHGAVTYDELVRQRALKVGIPAKIASNNVGLYRAEGVAAPLLLTMAKGQVVFVVEQGFTESKEGETFPWFRVFDRKNNWGFVWGKYLAISD